VVTTERTSFEKISSTNINSVKYGASRKLRGRAILSKIAYIKFIIDAILVKSCMSSVNQCCLHTQYLTTTLLYLSESYSNLREDLYFFPTTFHFRILSYTLWVARALFMVSRQHFVFLVSMHSAAIPPTSPTHTSPFSTKTTAILLFLFSLTLPSYPVLKFLSSQTTALLPVFYRISHSL